MAIDYTETRKLALAYFMSGMTNEQFCEYIGMSMQSFKDRKHGCKEIFDQAQREVIALKGKKAISRSDAQTEQQPKSDADQVENKIMVEWPNGTKMDFYSLEDFEEFKFYGTMVDTYKDPSDKDFLELKNFVFQDDDNQ